MSILPIVLLAWYRAACFLLIHFSFDGCIIFHIMYIYIYYIYICVCIYMCVCVCVLQIITVIKLKIWVYSHYSTHWGQMTHICVRKLTIFCSDNSLSPGWRLAIIETNAGILLIGHLGTNFSEILIKIYTVSFKNGFWQCRLENGGHFVSSSMY